MLLRFALLLLCCASLSFALRITIRPSTGRVPTHLTDLRLVHFEIIPFIHAFSFRQVRRNLERAGSVEMDSYLKLGVFFSSRFN